VIGFGGGNCGATARKDVASERIEGQRGEELANLIKDYVERKVHSGGKGPRGISRKTLMKGSSHLESPFWGMISAKFLGGGGEEVFRTRGGAKITSGSQVGAENNPQSENSRKQRSSYAEADGARFLQPGVGNKHYNFKMVDRELGGKI